VLKPQICVTSPQCVKENYENSRNAISIREVLVLVYCKVKYPLTVNHTGLQLGTCN
jgi:hypothetical protein